MKKIKIEEINTLLQVIYDTNITAKQFDAVKRMFENLPDDDDSSDNKNEVDNQ